MDITEKAWNYFLSGGPVMFILLLDSVWMWTLIIERILYFRGKALPSIQESRQITQKYEDAKDPFCLRLITEFAHTRTGDRRLDRKLLEQYVIKEKTRLRHNLAFISILAVIAPLLGLLGTVTGMMDTFNVIAVFGTGNAQAMAGGISKALVTTQSGLTVAIPGMFMNTILHRRADRIENTLNRFIIHIENMDNPWML